MLTFRFSDTLDVMLVSDCVQVSASRITNGVTWDEIANPPFPLLEDGDVNTDPGGV